MFQPRRPLSTVLHTITNVLPKDRFLLISLDISWWNNIRVIQYPKIPVRNVPVEQFIELWGVKTLLPRLMQANEVVKPELGMECGHTLPVHSSAARWAAAGSMWAYEKLHGNNEFKFVTRQVVGHQVLEQYTLGQSGDAWCGWNILQSVVDWFCYIYAH